MSLKCELTPMELLFCAKVMQGKYLDYDYFRRTPDIQINYVRHEQETLESLDEEGIVELDFDGNAEMDSDYESLLKPVFFGEKESRLDVEGKPSRRFHIYEGRIVMSLIGEEKIEFREVTEKEMETFLNEENIEIYLADIKSGSKNGVFTAEDLKSGIYKEMAMSLLKGEL